MTFIVYCWPNVFNIQNAMAIADADIMDIGSQKSINYFLLAEYHFCRQLAGELIM